MQSNQKIGRNAPCPCGSKKKYKQCCLAIHDHQKTTDNSSKVSITNLLNLALDFQNNGHLQKADAVYQQILNIEPNNADALHLLGMIARKTGKTGLAIELINKAITRKSTATMHYNLGLCLQDQGSQDDAVKCFKNVIMMNPEFAKAYASLGFAMQEQADYESAIDYYRKAINIHANESSTHLNLGTALQEIGDMSAALKHYHLAHKINPYDPVVYNNIGHNLSIQSQIEPALVNFHKALDLKPDYVEAYNNLGAALSWQGKHESAISYFQKAIAIDSDFYKAHWNEAISLLSLGKLQQGWKKYEYRLQLPEQINDNRHFMQPRYCGEDLHDKNILISSEQGLGDEIRFANVLPDIINSAQHCVIECSQKLVPLYSRSFPTAEVIPKSNPAHERARSVDIDFQCPVGSLPQWFRGSIDSFPNHNGYLIANKDRVLFWKDRLETLDNNIKVGICWRSMLQNITRNQHYTKLDQWTHVLNTPGVTFINLQYDNCINELAEVQNSYGIEIHNWDDIDLLNDLDEAAALTTALDLIIAPSTSVAAMAGALGKNTWYLIEAHGMGSLGTQCSPWFPRFRNFNKNYENDWASVLDLIASELAHLRSKNATDNSFKY